MNAETITKRMNFFRFNFASSQKISLSNPLTPGYPFEVILQALLHRCGLRYLQTILHKGRNNLCHGDLGRIHPQIMAVLYGEVIFVENTVQNLCRPFCVGDYEADISAALGIQVRKAFLLQQYAVVNDADVIRQQRYFG